MKKSPIKNKKESKKSYAKDEVLVMFESLRDDISILAEGQQGIRDDLDNFKEETNVNFRMLKDELTEFKVEMYSFKDEMYSFKEETNNNFKAMFEY